MKNRPFADDLQRRRHNPMEEWKNPNEMTVEELIAILQEEDPKAIVINGNEENIRIYPGKENKAGGRPVLLIC
jgi:hypothetical protein